MEEMADDLNGLLDELAIDDCALAGVSMGGYIALSFWTKYAKRVRRLVLSNTRARLRQMYSDNHTFQIKDETGDGFLVSIKIPFRTIPDRVSA